MKIASLIILINVFITFTIAQPTIIRCCHGSAITDKKLYVGGGFTTGAGAEAIVVNDFFSLDLTKSFSTSSPANMSYAIGVSTIRPITNIGVDP